MTNGQSNPTTVNATKSSADPSPQIAPQAIMTILTKKYKIQIIILIYYLNPRPLHLDIL